MRNSGLSAELVGSFRPRVGWVGGSSPLDAAYVPPPPGEIPELVDDLLGFADSGAGLDPVSHAAILHAQFEAIHPYADGNGRLGRVLVTRALRRADLTRRTTVPVSVAIARDPGGYLSGLAQFEQGHAGPWIRWFAEVAERAAAATGSLAAQTRGSPRSGLTDSTDCGQTAQHERSFPCWPDIPSFAPRTQPTCSASVGRRPEPLCER